MVFYAQCVTNIDFESFVGFECCYFLHGGETWSPFMYSQVFEPYYVIPVKLSSNSIEFVEQRLYIEQLLLLDVCSLKDLIGRAEVS